MYRLAMTDISKKNSHTSSSLGSRSNNLFLDRLVAISKSDDINTATNIRQENLHAQERYKRSPSIEMEQQLRKNENRYQRSRHRIRHARKHRRLGQAALNESDRNFPKPKARIEVHVIDTKNANETNRNPQHPSPGTLPFVMSTPPTTTSNLIAQIPSDLNAPKPTHAIVNRLQRSPLRKRNHGRRRKKKRANNHCQKQDLARNAYIADTVMLARAESMSVNRTENANYSVTFKIIEVFKSNDSRNSGTIRLTFIYSKRPQNCEPRHESRLVKANIKQMTPMLRKKEAKKKGSGKRDGSKRRNGNNSSSGQIAIVRKVCNPAFEPNLQVPQIERIEDEKTITCTVKGFPIPIITWFMNNSKISSDTHRKQIIYNRRNSTLKIGKTEYGVYKCVASIGSKSAESEEIFDKGGGVYFPDRPCDIERYCMNGGKCFIVQSIGEPYCSCVGGFEGQRCDQKSSTYQQNVTSCNLPHYKDEHFCKE
ncbi:putative immunoglobulin [Trypoxylus dichotomus]